MSNEKYFDPLFGFKQLSGMWDKQLNGLLYRLTDNKEFVRTASVGLNTYSFYLERMRKNQELIAALMNIPTKKDIADAAKLTIQAEEKIDILEEQIWDLQDTVTSITKENAGMFEEIVNIVMQMKDELKKMALEAAETQKMKANLHELRQGLVDIKIIQVSLQELRKEIDGIKSIKTDLKKINNSTNESNSILSDLSELKHGLNQLSDIKTELASLKNLVGKEKEKQRKEPEKKQDKELVLTGSNPTK